MRRTTMSSKKLAKKVLITTLSASMVLPFGSAVYANTQALPNGTIVTENGVGYLKDSNGEKYSGWFFDSNDEWYYFNETNKAMKKGWHHDDKDGYWYYLNSSNGKMATGWQKIDGKEYFFQPVRDMGNYHFNNEQEKWLYSMNSKVPYGAMYVSTTTPDGFKVDGSGAKVAEETAAQSGNTNASSGTQTTKNGWVSENGSWHYYENGTLAKNKWLNVSGKWYYVVSDGSMISNTWKEIGGKSYYFGADGAMYVNTTTPDGNKVDSNGVKVVASTNLVNVANFVGVFVPYYGITGNSGVKIQSISGGRISGKAVTDDDAFSEFDVPLSGNKFTITYKIADIEWEDAKDEVISWNGIRGTYTKTYELVIKNGVPALTDGTLKEYDILEKSDSSYDDNWISSWYSELSGERWNKAKITSNSSTSKDYSKYVGSYGFKEMADTGSVGTYGTGDVEITKIANNKIYGTFIEHADASDWGCDIDFSNGVSINSDDTFVVQGEEYYRKWDENNYKRAKYTIKFQLGTDDGRPTIEGIDVTGGLNDGSDWDWGMETYYKVLR
jgi:glucan-binding YG repeat protein